MCTDDAEKRQRVRVPVSNGFEGSACLRKHCLPLLLLYLLCCFFFCQLGLFSAALCHVDGVADRDCASTPIICSIAVIVTTHAPLLHVTSAIRSTPPSSTAAHAGGSEPSKPCRGNVSLLVIASGLTVSSCTFATTSLATAGIIRRPSAEPRQVEHFLDRHGCHEGTAQLHHPRARHLRKNQHFCKGWRDRQGCDTGTKTGNSLSNSSIS